MIPGANMPLPGSMSFIQRQLSNCLSKHQHTCLFGGNVLSPARLLEIGDATVTLVDFDDTMKSQFAALTPHTPAA